MAKRRKDDKEGVPEWVVTYGDLMSLLLTFFILLAAFSELKQPREYRKAIEAINEALGFEGGLGLILAKGNPRNSSINRLPRQAKMAGDHPSRADVNDPNLTGRDRTVSRVHDGLRWTIGGTIGFQPGSFELTPEARRTLLEAAEKIRGQNRKVLLRGHAWGIADKQGGLDYIELSFRRAQAAVEFLVNEGDVREALLLPVAAGNSEPRNVDRLSNEAARENRRVEVMVTEVLLEELHPDPEWQGNAGTGSPP